MNIWDWVNEYHKQASAEGDQKRMRLYSLYEDANTLKNTDVDGAIAKLKQGRLLAEQLNEPWWIAFYDHWIAQHLIHRKLDYSAALALVVKAIVEVRKPIYQQFPQRICLYEDLIKAYSGLDPVGYESEIREAITFMETEVDPTSACNYCLQGIRISFAMKLSRWDEAKKYTAAYMSMADSSKNIHYQVAARTEMCLILRREKQWERLAELAHEGVDLSILDNNPLAQMSFLGWEAVAQYRLGSPEEANRLYRQALILIDRTDGIPRDITVCAYLETIGELDAAIKLLERGLQAILAMGNPYAESQRRLTICKLRAKMGILTESDLSQARAAAHKLRFPDSVLKKLDKLGQPKA